jgi:(3,5-dihydroxyphenyl)acetyl-CoA 1,2-dioxygenase
MPIGGIPTISAKKLPAAPKAGRLFAKDAPAFSKFWKSIAAARTKLPPKAERNSEQEKLCTALHALEREARERFLAAHVNSVYATLTSNYRNFFRVGPLVAFAAKLVPGLLPSPATLEAESKLALKDKNGAEIDQGIFISHVLAHEKCGPHLLQAMLQPHPQTKMKFAEYMKSGEIDLGAAHVSRRGKATIVEMRNPRFLNAIDDTTVDAIDIAIDLAILDPETEIAVLRGGFVEHPRYKDRRVFSAGLNLSHLYYGKISFLFYFHHIIGFEHKIMRGLADSELHPDDILGNTREKPWLACVETFAIGGGCQHLLAMDYVLAESSAYLTLPARKEGIIPGAANLRLPRFVGMAAARQAIMYGRRFECDSPEGRMICDEIVPPGEMDAALDKVIAGFTDSGMVSAVGNRRHFRIGQEPLDEFRRYMALFAREQAYCHFSPALVANLEQHWNAKERKI